MSENAVTLSGIYDMPAAEYHADPCVTPSLSNSVAQILLNKSPLHAWCAHPRLNPKYRSDDDPKFDIGTAAHALLLEGSSAKIVVVEADDWRTKVAKEARDEANANGMTAVLAKHNVALNRMVDAAKAYVAQSEIAGIFDSGKPEQTVIWCDDGPWCRARPDWLAENHRIVLDYKTTTDAAPDAFSRQLVRMGYHFQASFYLRGMAHVSEIMPQFVFLVQEVEPPFACSLHACSPMLRELADAEVERAIELWHSCQTLGKWPGYSGRIAWADAPAWLINRTEAE